MYLLVRVSTLSCFIFYSLSSAQTIVQQLSPPPPAPLPNQIELEATMASEEVKLIKVHLHEPSRMTNASINTAPPTDQPITFKTASTDPTLHGGVLQLDSSTPKGTYYLEDGRSIDIQSDFQYPRYYSISDKPRNFVSLLVRSPRQVGILMWRISDQAPAATSLTTGELLSKFSASLQAIQSGEPRNDIATPYPYSTNKAYVVEMDIPDGVGPLQIVSFGFGRPATQSSRGVIPTGVNHYNFTGQMVRPPAKPVLDTEASKVSSTGAVLNTFTINLTAVSPSR